MKESWKTFKLDLEYSDVIRIFVITKTDNQMIILNTIFWFLNLFLWPVYWFCSIISNTKRDLYHTKSLRPIAKFFKMAFILVFTLPVTIIIVTASLAIVYLAYILVGLKILEWFIAL